MDTNMERALASLNNLIIHDDWEFADALAKASTDHQVNPCILQDMFDDQFSGEFD